MCGHLAGTMNAQILTIGVGGTGPHYVFSYGWVILQSHLMYTLWLKRDTDHRLTLQQKEELHVRVEVWQEISFPHLISKFCCVILCNAMSLMRRGVNDKMFTLDCKNGEFVVFR